MTCHAADFWEADALTTNGTKLITNKIINVHYAAGSRFYRWAGGPKTNVTEYGY